MSIKSGLKNLFTDNFALPWVIIFLLINVIARGTGGHNEGARLATLRAMSEQGSFVINKYEWGDDWSINEKGEKFANKAPGPIFLGFPVYFILDNVFKNHKKAHIDKDGHNTTRLRATPRAIFSIIMQVIPFAFLLLWLSKKLEELKIQKAAILFSSLALLFGNTSTIFMNTYFGHGMAAAFSICLTYFLFRGNFKLVGLFYGLTLLSEYAAAVIFPVLLLTIFIRKESPSTWIKDLVLGGAIPGLFWCWYHISCFGSPFETAIQNENPLFLNNNIEHGKLLFGMFSLPNIDVVLKLLFGRSRGLLFTQPWALFLIFLLPFLYLKKNINNDIKSVLFFSWTGMLVMIFMNSSFNGWHGGMTAGPRYLSITLAPLALSVCLVWNELNLNFKKLLFLLLVLSIEFRGRVFATTILAPYDISLWNFQWDIILSKNKHLFRYFLWLFLFGFTWFKWGRKQFHHIEKT